MTRCAEGAEAIALVAAAQRGDRAAFERLYAIYARLVHGVLIARVPRLDVEDLLQDVFVQAMERLPSLRDPAAIGAWLCAIARHRAADHHRRAPAVCELRDDVAGPDSSAQGEALEALSVIRALPAAYRDTLVLRLVEGMTGPEIAAATGLTPASVRVNLHRGMKLLRERLNGRVSR